MGSRLAAFGPASRKAVLLHPAALIPGDDLGIIWTDLLSLVPNGHDEDRDSRRNYDELRVLKHARTGDIASPPQCGPGQQPDQHSNVHVPRLRFHNIDLPAAFISRDEDAAVCQRSGAFRNAR